MIYYNIRLIVEEQAAEDNLLFVLNDTKHTHEYMALFQKIFKEVTIISSHRDAYDEYKNNPTKYDLIVIQFTSNFEEEKLFVQAMRKQNELIRIYALATDLNLHHTQLHSCFCIDGYIPYPFDSILVNNFLYRQLSKITSSKFYDKYIEKLECDNLNILPTNVIKSEIIEDEVEVDEQNSFPKKERRRIEQHREEHIRFNQSDKMTASDFMQTVDDMATDKIENFVENIDELILELYDFEDADPKKSLDTIVEMQVTLNSFSELIFVIGPFSIIAHSFEELSAFLGSLEEDDFADKENKSLLVTMLVGIMQDLDLWAKTIFVEQETNDIHYLDASFANNILEIEVIFQNQELEHDDEDDLEFF